MSDDKLAPLAKLRESFPENQISQLPKPLKKREEMDKLPKATCKVCGGYHATSSMIHLSYVGHAALTNRLLDTDPEWTWEPMAVDATGYPVIDKDGGMWIKLTVCGVTRYGYGDAQGKSGGDAMKERIGDALRNAAMRFGAALDLWHKGELHVEEEAGKKEEKKETKKEEKPKTPAATPPGEKNAAQSLLEELAEWCGLDDAKMEARLYECSEYSGKHLTLERVQNPDEDPGKRARLLTWCGVTLGKVRERRKYDELPVACDVCGQPIFADGCACPKGGK